MFKVADPACDEWRVRALVWWVGGSLDRGVVLLRKHQNHDTAHTLAHTHVSSAIYAECYDFHAVRVLVCERIPGNALQFYRLNAMHSK